MVWALSKVKGPDIQFAASSSSSSVSMICGWRLAEGRFCGRKVTVRGGGLSIREPKVISFTRLGKRSEILQRSCVDFQFDAMYGVI